MNIGMIACVDELRFVWTMFRHGARAPEGGLDEDSKDIFGNFWNSPGELTEVGMRMQYLLGRKNMLHYADFLPDSWDPNYFYVKSTDYNRTMMSVQSQLNGMFPPGTGPTLSEFQQSVAYPPNSWDTIESIATDLGNDALPHQMQVFPVHLFPRSDNQFFFFYSASACEPVKGLIGANLKQTLFSDWMTQFNNDYGEKLRTALGHTDDDQYYMSYTNLYLFMDTFVAAYYDGRDFSDLVDAGIDVAALNVTAF